MHERVSVPRVPIAVALCRSVPAEKDTRPASFLWFKRPTARRTISESHSKRDRHNLVILTRCTIEKESPPCQSAVEVFA